MRAFAFGPQTLYFQRLSSPQLDMFDAPCACLFVHQHALTHFSGTEKIPL